MAFFPHDTQLDLIDFHPICSIDEICWEQRKCHPWSATVSAEERVKQTAKVEATASFNFNCDVRNNSYSTLLIHYKYSLGSI